jgi:hypothetical protein
LVTNGRAASTEETPAAVPPQAEVRVDSPSAPAGDSGLAETEPGIAPAFLDDADDVSAAPVVSITVSSYVPGDLYQAGRASAVVPGGQSVLPTFRSSDGASPMLTPPQIRWVVTASSGAASAPLTPVLLPSSPSGAQSGSGGDDMQPASVLDLRFRLE